MQMKHHGAVSSMLLLLDDQVTVHLCFTHTGFVPFLSHFSASRLSLSALHGRCGIVGERKVALGDFGRVGLSVTFTAHTEHHICDPFHTGRSTMLSSKPSSGKMRSQIYKKATHRGDKCLPLGAISATLIQI